MIFSDHRHGSVFIVRSSLEYNGVHTKAATALTANSLQRLKTILKEMGMRCRIVDDPIIKKFRVHDLKMPYFKSLNLKQFNGTSKQKNKIYQ